MNVSNLFGLLCIGAVLYWLIPAALFVLLSMARGTWDLRDVNGIVLWKDEGE